MRMAEQAGFEKAVSGADAVINDPDVDVVVIATPHDTHAAFAAQALRAGKHVFCEKPLALTMDEVGDVESAWQNGVGATLFVGFNRRFSPAVGQIADHFRHGTGPMTITYRVSAGPLPKGHWYHNRWQGGRLLGEICHFIDTCSAIIGDSAVEVQAVGSAAGNEIILDENLIVTLRYPNGSLAAITYSSTGHLSTRKESIEILGRDHSAIVVDFAHVVLDGKMVLTGSDKKGYRSEVAAFRQQIISGSPANAQTALASTRTTLLAASRLATRQAGA